MGFRQKSRGIRFGRHEYFVVFLALLTTAAGFGWWKGVAPQSKWRTTTARLVSFSISDQSEGPDAVAKDSADLLMEFEYTVEGKVFRGETRSVRVSHMLFGTMPPEVLAVLHSKGISRFSDLPEDLQALLRQRGMTGFDKIPVGAFAAARAKGYESLEDVPPEVERLYDEGKYREAAEAAGFSEEELAQITADSIVHENHLISEGGGVTSRQVVRGSLSPVIPGLARTERSEMKLRVRYDPLNPGKYELALYPNLAGLLNIAVFLCIATFTLYYCGVLYPRAKQR